jgi:hypothetical protein
MARAGVPVIPPCTKASPVYSSPTAAVSASGMDRPRRLSSPRRPKTPIATREATSSAATAARPSRGLTNQAQNATMAALPAPANSRPRPVAGPSLRRRATTLSSATPGVTVSTHRPANIMVTASARSTPDRSRPTPDPQTTSSAAMTDAAGHAYGRPAGWTGSVLDGGPGERSA